MTAIALPRPAVDRRPRTESAARTRSARTDVRVAERQDARLRLTRRGRLVRSVLLLVVLLAVVAAAMVAAGAPAALAEWADGPGYVSVTVQPGDSLWEYARTYAPEQDPRDYVLEVQRANHLPTTSITAGTQIDLPLEPAGR
ncbi:LysM peptidoglycan-binding domain-containing protein [Brachybacterium huguangmaarense]